MSEPASPQPVNHHADHPGFAGIGGALCGLVFLLVGRANARLVVALARPAVGDHVVDVGCGPGTAARAAARRGARVTGVDPAETMLRLARAVTHRQDVTWAEGSAEALPVADGTATVVWALATVHHWRDASAGVAEAHRVLRAGGRLIAIERRTTRDATGLSSHGWTREQAESFAELCRTTGFVDVDVRGERAGRRDVWAVIGHRA
ncbi:SAM-dependent methyltransferase [Mycolicibacterium arabiense]|uniref:SAM-dependent methyltransferase n=1 Tax=Mycolicibacterium arabiense TaxID=1286181 RepID=A0A7I7RUQ6_9MYCO|nr:class I SAM-dependent methyltransferase [Mycolicibacterium arabiense]MCV7375133.1 class I SAM-dependent methyltransferase [Mycolicibacterium arabiense]BBY48277.1 SAM-dependent methyltransferase [Mycolicibacterium arabiense]